MFAIYCFHSENNFCEKKCIGKMQFWTILLHFALCVTEKRKYVNKGCNLVNPYRITVLLKIPFNKLPSFGTQFSSTGVQEPFCKHWLSIVVERFPVIAQHFKITFTKPSILSDFHRRVFY